MFSSNQIFKISGTFSQLKMSLDFALAFSGDAKNMTKSERERGCKLTYQIAGDKYLIGWAFGEVPEGWKEYDFDFDTDIVSKIIVQFLKKQEVSESEYDYFDGGTDDGFIMNCRTDIMADREGKVKNPFYCIVSFSTFKNYYAK